MTPNVDTQRILNLFSNVQTAFCSMKITQDVRQYAKEQKVEAEKALAVGKAEKAKEFVAGGGEIYHGNLPEGADEHH